MSIIDIFSKRQKALRGEMPDVYRYDRVPEPLRVQIVHIMLDALGYASHYQERAGRAYPKVVACYDTITDALCREYGVFYLSKDQSTHESKGIGALVSRGGGEDHSAHRGRVEDLYRFFLREKNIEKVLDVIELSFRMIDRITRTHDYLRKHDPSGDADRAIDELNGRFKEHGVGYCFTDGRIVRIDSEYIHSEVVRPALRILDRRQYAGAREEFLKAHEHHRNGNAKEALNECLKSLESVMKSICDKRGWRYGEHATASKLVDICFDKELIPSFWQSHFDALRSVLKSGAPTARNKLGGHGQGATPKPVPGYVAAYALHMTAAAIVFLADAEASSGAS